MNREFILEGLDCPNCAAKIEKAVGAIDFVSSASYNFVKSTLKLEFEEAHEPHLFARLDEIVHKLEPHVSVIEKVESITNENSNNRHKKKNVNGKREICMLIIGAAALACALALNRFQGLNEYLKLAAFIITYLILGAQVLIRAARNILHGDIFDENFLMCIATLGAFATGNYSEACAVMLFYQIGEFFQELAVRRSKKSIADLMDIRPDFANLEHEGEIKKVSPETVKVGDIILVRPGEKIPLDGLIIEGETMLDTKALTGESVPREAIPGDSVLSGCINQNGLLRIKVSKTFGESTVAKIIDMVENASSKKAATESFITKFSKIYTPVVVALASMLAIIPPLLFGGGWSQWINRGLIFLVISCPCALVVSIPLGFFGGIGGASRKGVLIKGGNYLEALNHLEVVVFDKTGTLTKGVFEVNKIIPANGYSEEELLKLAAQAEAFSNHPIALSILKAYKNEPERDKITDFKEISGQGTEAAYDGKRLIVGNALLMKARNIQFTQSGEVGTRVYAAIDGVYAGCIIISDMLKPDSREAIAALKAKDIKKTVMLTGDNREIAEAIAAEVGVDEVYSELLPDGKVEMLEMLYSQKSSKGKLAFIGDGINDAPVLARSDIGIAMGALGSDAAIEAADIVLMTDEPSKLIKALEVAAFTKRVVWQNIIFALGIKCFFLILGAFGIANMWEAVFADVGVALLAILNAMRVIRKK